MPFTPPLADMRQPAPSDLNSDCSSCFGLCCVALPYAASSDFALDKPAGQPCSHLKTDFRCSVHTDLRKIGYRGCTVYDCFGAGQKVSLRTFEGTDWRNCPDIATSMFTVFPVMRQLHELLWYMREAIGLSAAAPVREELTRMTHEVETLTELPPESIMRLDVATHRAEINVLLTEASELARAAARAEAEAATGRKRHVRHGRGADFIGAKLGRADFSFGNLRGAYLIAADLRGAAFSFTDLTGADLRDADLRGADLADTLFLTQMQLNAAVGDKFTRIPAALSRPMHWR
ncbi:pentapeptide repeat-containing protein [Paenibacillus sp. NPDC058071]|uniref:pentapeptide repeat-containing protein n=1 Tax=Paenibacillus sp. NPDC058071 TaxID=3346326 RepID=UPI0036D7A0CF